LFFIHVGQVHCLNFESGLAAAELKMLPFDHCVGWRFADSNLQIPANALFFYFFAHSQLVYRSVAKENVTQIT
jgi:hypothetical protein